VRIQFKESVVDPTESTPQNPGDERVSSEPTPAAETAHSSSPAGESAAAPTEGHSGEIPATPPGDAGAPRPRRRRRRRRRPGQNLGPPVAAAANENAPPSETGAAVQTEHAPVAQRDPAALGGASESASDRETLRLRRRPRRRRPRPDVAAPGPERRMLQGPVTAGPDGLPAGTEATGEAAPVPPAIRELRARRRRRRKPSEARSGTASQAQAPTEGGEGAGPAGAAAAPGQERSRPRQRRRHRTAPGDAPAGDRPPREDRGPRRESRDRPERQGERGPRGDRDAGPRDRRGVPPGRGRDAAPRKIERKLYHIDSVVDRGFEDVEEEGDTRRVHWTILKRTTADQVSRKALSALYVLQRDGADTEFPSLGAARDAVNKKIVHPEKLTRSKAEYAAEKK
jgi:hypothetical protein